MTWVTFAIFEDHPRSRGVYACAWVRRRMPAGSSPLARGLPDDARAEADRFRIIPARAGFTGAPSCTGGVHRDHPRSRGVYSRGFATTSRMAGSSPLARGLRPFLCPPVRTHVGSSPLARGLLASQPSPLSARGIIPARAGFTPHPSADPYSLVDHPRSRGVYPTTRWRPCALYGSSPLARGLQPGEPRQGLEDRIIPARAGFTRPMTRTPSGLGDHPRSRGVYTA